VQAITTQSPDSSAELARDLLAVAIHVFKGSSQGYYRLVDELDLSISQTRTLDCLERRDVEVSVNELATAIGLSVPATSRNVDALLRRGYLERREDPHDRRIKRVRISPEGRALVARMNAARLDGMAAFAATLSPRERSRLRAALACLVARADIGACRPTSSAAEDRR
jgi:DNA-binding MarR family transcriptional regulator